MLFHLYFYIYVLYFQLNNIIKILCNSIFKSFLSILVRSNSLLNLLHSFSNSSWFTFISLFFCVIDDNSLSSDSHFNNKSLFPLFSTELYNKLTFFALSTSNLNVLIILSFSFNNSLYLLIFLLFSLWVLSNSISYVLHLFLLIYKIYFILFISLFKSVISITFCLYKFIYWLLLVFNWLDSFNWFSYSIFNLLYV